MRNITTPSPVRIPIFILFILCALPPATHAQLPRSSPVVLANVLFNSYTEKDQMGHLAATRIYDPQNPGQTQKTLLWDAGEILNQISPDQRNIYVPRLEVNSVNEAVIGTGDGTTRTFSGILDHPILPCTITISDHTETFSDYHSRELKGNRGGLGSINRFTGEFEITFNEPPGPGVPVKCSYNHYKVGSTLESFDKQNVDFHALGLGATSPDPESLTFDLNGDNAMDESDGDFLIQWVRGYSDGVSVKKDWILGPVGGSTPAIATPVGKPHWYYGTATSGDEQLGYDVFAKTHEKRPTVLFVGGEDGMLHAFDAGSFRWGDNPETLPVEARGYFEWVPLDEKGLNKAPDYGTGQELWAFIPPALLSRLKNNFFMAEDKAAISGSPVISDAYFNGAWHTVLLCAEGGYGDGVFCLDVTDPLNPLFLWEFADPDLVRNPSFPAVPQVAKTLLGGVNQWIVFLPSGKALKSDTAPSIFLLNVEDGSLVNRVFLEAGMDCNNDDLDDAMGCEPSPRPAIIDSDGNGYVDRMYIGADNGLVFRANIPDAPEFPKAGIEQCVINTDFSYVDQEGFLQSVPADEQYRPIFAVPTVVVENSINEKGKTDYNIKILFGTADDPDTPDDDNATNYFFTYTDKAPKDECDPQEVTMDWFQELDPGVSVLTTATSAGGSVYFGTSCPKGDDFNTGPGEIHVLDLANGTVIDRLNTGNVFASPLVEDEHLYVRTPESDGKDILVMGGGKYNNDVVKSPDSLPRVQTWKEIWQ